MTHEEYNALLEAINTKKAVFMTGLQHTLNATTTDLFSSAYERTKEYKQQMDELCVEAALHCCDTDDIPSWNYPMICTDLIMQNAAKASLLDMKTAVACFIHSEAASALELDAGKAPTPESFPAEYFPRDVLDYLEQDELAKELCIAVCKVIGVFAAEESLPVALTLYKDAHLHPAVIVPLMDAYTRFWKNKIPDYDTKKTAEYLFAKAKEPHVKNLLLPRTQK